MRQETKLKRTLGFSDLLAMAIGQIIGAGIMSNTGVAIGMTGTGVALAFILSPFLTLLAIGFPNAVLGSALPTTGGPYRYSSRLMGKSAGMLYLLMFVSTNIMIASYCLSFASYFVSIFTGFNQQAVSIFVIVFFYIINLLGTKQAAVVGKIMTVVLIAGLAIFIVFGIGKADVAFVFKPENMFCNGVGSFLASVALLSSATSGAQMVIQVGGEVKNPKQTVPRVIVLSTLLVGVFYVFIGIIASGVLPIEQVADQPLTYVAQATMPQSLVYLFVICAALGATATTLNASFVFLTKPLLIACDDGLLPRSFGTVSKRGVPWKVLTFWFLLGLIPLAGGFSLSVVSKFTVANSLILKAFSNVCLIVLCVKYPDALKKAGMKMSNSLAIGVSVIGAIVLVILSYTLFAKLNLTVLLVLAGFVVAVLIYTKVIIKDVEIPDDLDVDQITSSVGANQE